MTISAAPTRALVATNGRSTSSAEITKTAISDSRGGSPRRESSFTAGNVVLAHRSGKASMHSCMSSSQTIFAAVTLRESLEAKPTMANATGSGQTAASTMHQLKNSMDTAMIVVERIAPYRDATKRDWFCSSTAQSFHERRGQVGEVFLAEEGARKFPPLLFKPHPAHAGLHLDDKIGVIVSQKRNMGNQI